MLELFKTIGQKNTGQRGCSQVFGPVLRKKRGFSDAGRRVVFGIANRSGFWHNGFVALLSYPNKTQSLQSLDEFISLAGEKNLDLNYEEIRKAYHFSEKAHRGQRRRDGTPYILHPLSVAGVLAELCLDQESIITGLLHDVVEDTEASLNEIEREFGEKVAFLVDGVTKISRIQFQNSRHRQSENIRKMIVAMSQDIRVILVKLADRLHNMRTLSFMPLAKQPLIAEETLEIYSPLAARLGIHEIKTELEDLSFKYSHPEPYRRLKQKMRDSRERRDAYAAEALSFLKKELSKSLKGDFEVQGRCKNFYSIYRKMTRKRLSFEEIHDILAFRICVDALHACYEVLGLIHSMWKPVPGGFKDFIAIPKANNYQSLHTTVIGLRGLKMEIQIRTKQMHLTAERGIAAHWIYKSKNPEKVIQSLEKFNWLKDLADFQRKTSESNEFLDHIKRDLFESEVYVFTPQGDIKEFPKAATPIDFAYAIHSDVGAHCAGAKINGRQAPLKSRLKSGDTVEILTSPSARPNKDWLKISVTSRARSKIQSFVKAEERKKALQIGEKLFEKNCQKFKISEKKTLQSENLFAFMKAHGLNKKEDLYVALGFGRMLPSVLFRALRNVEESAAWTPAAASPKRGEKSKKKSAAGQSSALLVEGSDQIMVSFAKCCCPVAGDDIRAYLSRNKGIAAHRADCPLLLEISSDRFIDVAWRAAEEKTPLYEISLEALCEDGPGILQKMSQAFSGLGLNITDVHTFRTAHQKVCVRFSTKVKRPKPAERIADPAAAD